MTNFALYVNGLLPGGLAWSSRIYATGSISEADASSACATAWGALWAEIEEYLPADSTATEAWAYTLNSSWKFETGTQTDLSLAGTSASKSMPISSSACITWRTNQRTKKGHGRAFLPPAATNAIATAADTGKLLPAFQTAISTGATTFLSDITGAALTPVLLNRAALATTPITSAQAGDLFRQQRRRQSKLAPTYV